jgi:hypothetical protein
MNDETLVLWWDFCRCTFLVCAKAANDELMAFLGANGEAQNISRKGCSLVGKDSWVQRSGVYVELNVEETEAEKEG